AGPVVAGLFLASRESGAVGLRARQGVVPVGGIAAAVDDIALLGHRRLLAAVVFVHMQVGGILCNARPFVVLPRPLVDAVACVDRRLTVGCLGAEISVPGVAPRSNRLRQLLADPVGSRQAAEVGTLAGAGAGHKEGHVGSLLRRANTARADCQNSCQRNGAKSPR